MTVISRLLSEPERRILATALESKWSRVAGFDMPRSNFAWDSVSVETSSTQFTITAQLDSLDFEGFSDDYARLTIATEISGASASEEHQSYFHGQGQEVRSVWIVRDSVTSSADNAVFSYIVDVAIAFELDNGWIAIGLGSHRTEALAVCRAATRDLLDLPHLEDRWLSTLIQTYDYRHEWVEIS